MAYSRIHLILLCLLCVLSSYAQNPVDSRYVEENSFRMLQDKKWSELIVLGNSALESEIDYFYLRLRLGIAYYEQGKYRQAKQQFEKALEFNSGDALTQEYYYYSLLFSWQYDEARKFSTTLSDSVRTKLKTNERKGVSLLYAETGPKISGRKDLYSNALYFQAGLNHTISNKLSLSHVFTSYGQNLTVGAFYQYQYYLLANIPLSKGWSLAPAFHVVSQNLDSTIYIPPALGRPGAVTSLRVNSTSVIGAMAITKRWAFADVTYSTAISNVEGYAQYIQQLNLTFFPFGNNNLAIGNMAYFHSEKSSGTFAMNPFVTYKPADRWMLQLLYFTNQNKNLVERNGYFVNNSLDLTTSRWTGIADFSVNRHIGVYGVYMFENKITASGEAYDYATFILGLKIIP